MNNDNRVPCPYPSNIDCICRQGTLCGGFVGFAGFVPDKCPHYKPLRIEELLKVETRLLNKCDGCKHRRFGSCNREGVCKVQAAIDVIQGLERDVQGITKKNQQEHKTTSGVTFTGKEH